MRIVYVAAGAGGRYCGACMRDTALARGLVERGHDVQFLSLYTPVRADRSAPGHCRIFYGGINVYLEQHSALFRHMPGLLHRLFDSEWLLDFVGSRALEVRPEDLGEMTVSVLKGPAGRQAGELDALVDFLKQGAPPDVVNLTNSMLSAIAPALRQTLDVPVVCNLQGEDAFIDRIGEPWREEALGLIRQHARSIDVFVAPGQGYADAMADWLAVDRSRIRVVRPGIELAPFEGPSERPADVFRIGYLSRIVPEKGMDLLCEAFELLSRGRPGRVVLSTAAELAASDEAFWNVQRRRLEDAGLGDRIEFTASPDLAAKVAFLKRCSVFSVPSRVPERQAVACLEAQAAGLPVVLPDHGIHREIVSLTEGGLLVPPNDPRALADGLARLIDDADLATTLGERAAAGVREHFSSDVMVEKTLDVYGEVRRV